MKNIKEIYEALLAGKKLCYAQDPRMGYFHLQDGRLVSNCGETRQFNFAEPEAFYIYREPIKAVCSMSSFGRCGELELVSFHGHDVETKCAAGLEVSTTSPFVRLGAQYRITIEEIR